VRLCTEIIFVQETNMPYKVNVNIYSSFQDDQHPVYVYICKIIPIYFFAYVIIISYFNGFPALGWARG
jgi:hypothetical protein